jgi:nucleoside-diphosphate-sugar epimerase
MVPTVVVTAAAGPLGRRVCDLVAGDPDVARVVALDRPGRALAPTPRIEPHLVGLDDPDLARWFEGAAAVVHLGAGEPGAAAAEPAADGPGAVASTRAVLAAAAAAGVPTVVLLSTAMVYGAWPGNAVPLTEATPLRPVPGVAFAVERAEIERMAGQWRGEHDATVALLRSVMPVGPGQPPWLGRSPWSAAGPTVEEEPPMQFVHVDDLAAAVDLARRDRLDGPFNVAPDGWLPAAARRDLAGPVPRVPVPAAVAERVGALRWRLGLTGVPPAVLPYTMYPWVVANDRLKAAGWRPRHSNEEALVDVDPGSRLRTMPARRRQLLSLAALGGGAAGLVGGAVLVVRRVLRARRARARSGPRT